MKKRYVTQGRLARLERKISDRDRALIETLDRLRVATTGQLRLLHFADLTEASASRQVLLTLRRLSADRIVLALPRQVGGARAGSRATIWTLDLAGQKLASGCGPAGGPTRRPWTPALAFLAHRLCVSELLVELTEADRAGRCGVLEFEAEPLAWRRYGGMHGGYSYLKPDAFVRLQVRDFERGAFIEIDRSTESAAALGRKCREYRRYWESGREQDRRGYFPEVVFSVPSEARRDAVVEVLGRQPAETWPLYRVVLDTDLASALTREETP